MNSNRTSDSSWRQPRLLLLSHARSTKAGTTLCSVEASVRLGSSNYYYSPSPAT